jgi:membrane fusion protein, multidrug efflux system
MHRSNITSLARHALYAAAGLLALSSVSCQTKIEPEAHAGSPPPATPVSVAEAISATVTEASEYTGRSEAVDSVEIRPRVAGELERAAFREGDLVKKGDLLFVIDPRPYQAALARAQGSLAKSKADVAFAERDAARAAELIKSGSISGREWDSQNCALQQLTAAEQVASADVTAASLDVEFSTIRAPVSGRIGRLMVTPGNLVAPANPGPLTTLVSVDPLYVYVDVEEAHALQLARPHVAGHDDLVAHVAFGGEDDYPHEARLDFVDNRADPATGTTKVRLVVKNPDGKLSPGLFARVRLPEDGAARPAVLVSDRAVGTDQDRRYVLVVDKDNKVQYRSVKLGPLHEGLRVVKGGLAASERVVVRGLQRVRPGVAVTPEVVAMASVDHPDGAGAGQ